MPDHTDAPVHVMPYGDDDKMRVVAFSLDAGPVLLAYVGVRGQPNDGNARRIAALWNALRGISTEALEAVANQPTDAARMSALARVPFPAEFTPAPSD